MPCNPLNATINRYEAWNQGTCVQKQLLVRTAPFPLVTLIVGKIGQEFFVNFIWRCVLKTFVNLGAVAIRVLICKYKCKEQLKQIANAPLNMIRTFGRIVRLVECTLYALVAFVALKPALAQFKAAGLYRSKLESEEFGENIIYAFNKGSKFQLKKTQKIVDDKVQESVQGKSREIETLEGENLRLNKRVLELETALSSESGIANNAIKEEAGVANNAISALNDSLREAQLNLTTAQEEKKKLQEELEKRKNEGVTLVQNVMEAKTKEIEAKDKEILELKAQVEKLTTAPNATLQPVQDNDQQQQLKELEEKLKTAKEEADELQKQLQQSQQAKGNQPGAEVDDLKVKLNEKEGLVKRQAAQLKDLEDAQKSKETKITELEQEIRKLNASLTETKQIKDAAEGKVEEVKHVLDEILPSTSKTPPASPTSSSSSSSSVSPGTSKTPPASPSSSSSSSGSPGTSLSKRQLKRQKQALLASQNTPPNK